MVRMHCLQGARGMKEELAVLSMQLQEAQQAAAEASAKEQEPAEAAEGGGAARAGRSQHGLKEVRLLLLFMLLLCAYAVHVLLPGLRLAFCLHWSIKASSERGSHATQLSTSHSRPPTHSSPPAATISCPRPLQDLLQMQARLAFREKHYASLQASHATLMREKAQLEARHAELKASLEGLQATAAGETGLGVVGEGF